MPLAPIRPPLQCLDRSAVWRPTPAPPCCQYAEYPAHPNLMRRAAARVRLQTAWPLPMYMLQAEHCRVVIPACPGPSRTRQRRPIQPKPRNIIRRAAVQRQVGQHAPEHRAELEAVARAWRCDHDLRVSRVPVDDEM